MPEFEHSLTMRASADQVFDFIADVRNMPRYLPTTKSAQPQGDDRVRLPGEARGHRYDADGWVRRLADRNRLEWGADEGYYSGWLEAREDGDGQTRVTVHLRIDGAPPGAGEHYAPPERVREGLEAGLRSIQQQVEGTGGKVEPSAATDSHGADQRMNG